MPPRKRAETKPEQPADPAAEDQQETLTPATESDGDSNPPDPAQESAPAEPPAAPPSDDKAGDESKQPCGECFPNGWPTDGTRLGCTHGTWSRD